MKLKRTIFNICLMILAFFATGAIVVYNNYYHFEIETENNINSNQNQQTATESEESKFLNNLLSTIMTAENLSGTVLINGDGNTAVEGRIYYDSTSTNSLYTKIDGIYKDNSINLTAGMVKDKLYVNFLGTKFAINTQNALNAVLELIGGTTSGDFSSVLNLDTLKELLEDMTITKNENGGKTIKITIPDFTTLTIIANAKDFPTIIKTGVVTLGSERISLTILLDQTASTIPSISTKQYTEFLIDESTTAIITTFMNIIQTGGVKLTGGLSVNNSSVASISAVIDSSLNVKLSILSDIATADFYYYNGNFYLEILGSKIKVDAKGISQYFSSVFGANTTSSTPKITMLNSTTFEVLNNKIAISATNGNIVDLSITGKNYVLNLNLVGEKCSFNFTDNGFSSISFSSICNLTQNLQTHLNASEFDLIFNGSIGNYDSTIYGYAKLDNLNSLDKLTINAFIGSSHFAIYYKNGWYYLNTGSAKVKYSVDALDGLLSYLSSNLNLSAIEMQDIAELLEELQLKVLLKSGTRITFQTTYGNLTTDVYDENIDITTKGLNIGGTNISGKIKITPNSNYYSKYLAQIVPDSYNDLSSTTNLVKAVENSLKNNSSLSGKMTLSLGKILGFNTNITLVDLDVKIRSVYKSGKLGIEVVLENLPTNTLLTDYSSIFYSNHKVTLQFVGGEMRIYRTIYGRTTKKTFVETSKVIKLSDFSTDTIKDIFGIKSSIIKKFNSASSGENLNINTSAIIRGISATDNSLGVSLTSALNSLNITKFDAKISHSGGKVKAISMNIKLKNAIGIKLTLN